MNIFAIDRDPAQCAEWMVDRHVIKMILETCQLLSTAHRVLDGEMYIDKTKTGRKVKRWRLPDQREDVIYSATHINHPSTKWVQESVENYNWLVEHLLALIDEYSYRYEKTHKCAGDLTYALCSPPLNLKKWDWTDIPPAMDNQYIISEDFVENYRNYYKNGKKHLHSWKKRNPPKWIEVA